MRSIAHCVVALWRKELIRITQSCFGLWGAEDGLDFGILFIGFIICLSLCVYPTTAVCNAMSCAIPSDKMRQYPFGKIKVFQSNVDFVHSGAANMALECTLRLCRVCICTHIENRMYAKYLCQTIITQVVLPLQTPHISYTHRQSCTIRE